MDNKPNKSHHHHLYHKIVDYVFDFSINLREDIQSPYSRITKPARKCW